MRWVGWGRGTYVRVNLPGWEWATDDVARSTRGWRWEKSNDAAAAAAADALRHEPRRATALAATSPASSRWSATLRHSSRPHCRSRPKNRKLPPPTRNAVRRVQNKIYKYLRTYLAYSTCKHSTIEMLNLLYLLVIECTNFHLFTTKMMFRLPPPTPPHPPTLPPQNRKPIYRAVCFYSTTAYDRR